MFHQIHEQSKMQNVITFETVYPKEPDMPLDMPDSFVSPFFHELGDLCLTHVYQEPGKETYKLQVSS